MTAKNIIGKRIAETRTAGCRVVRRVERSAIAEIWVKSEEFILRLRLLGLPVPGALKGTPRLLQKDVVQARLVEPEVGDLEAL